MEGAGNKGEKEMLLRQIYHFQAIVQEGSFTEAAERCGISQSGISQSVKALETELGIELLVRKNRKFDLTEAGEHFYKKSLLLTADLEQMCRETIRIAHKSADELTVGYMSTYNGSELSRAVSMFAAQYPEVRVNLIAATHEELYERIYNGTVNLVIGDKRKKDDSLFEQVYLEEIPCYVEVPVDSPLAALDSVEVDALSKFPCMVVVSRDHRDTEMEFFSRDLGLTGEIIPVDSFSEARLLAVSNGGVVPVTGDNEDPFFEASLKRIPLIRDGEKTSITYSAFWKRTGAGPYAEKFAGILKSLF